MKRNRLDRELICLYGIVALVIATGILFFGMFFLNIDVENCNYVALMAAYSGISVIVWLALLCRNC